LAPSDEELVRHALDGETLSVAAKEHLELCIFCQQRLASYTSTNNLLLSYFYRSQCPDSTILSHYCMDMLSVDKAMSVTNHLDMCPLCTDEVAEVRLLLATFEPFPQELSSTPPALRTSSHIVAYPTPWQPQPIMWNGNDYERERPWPRQYQADTICISLHLTRDGQGAILLLGLLSSTNEAEHIELFTHTKVELYATHDAAIYTGKEYSLETGDPRDPHGPHGPLLVTQVDELGHIVFKSVLPGRYLMIIYLLETEIVIEELKVSFS
jgi:hypothetical protein